MTLFISLLAFIKKEFRQTLRDRRTLAVLIGVPCLQLIIFGYAANLDVRLVPTLLVDEDHTTESRVFLQEITAGDTFQALGYAESGAAAMDLLQRGKATLAVVVPRRYGEKLRKEQPAEVQILVDGGDSNRAMVAQNALNAFLTLRGINLLRARMERLSLALGAAPQVASIRIEPRILYNPSLDSRLYFVPGVAATLLLIVVLMVTALGLAREKESGTLEQVLVTPITPAVLVLGKTIPYALIGLLDLMLVLTVGAGVFGVPIRGNLSLVFAAGSLYLVAILGIGLFVSTLARNQQQAFVGGVFFNVPAILLSGFLTPIANMPPWMQYLTVLNPVRHFIEILRAVLLKQASFQEISAQLIAMAGIGVTTFMLASLLLRKRLQ